MMKYKKWVITKDILTLFIFPLCAKQFYNGIGQGKNSHFEQQSQDSYFAQDHYRIVMILILRRTYISHTD